MADQNTNNSEKPQPAPTSVPFGNTPDNVPVKKK